MRLYLIREKLAGRPMARVDASLGGSIDVACSDVIVRGGAQALSTSRKPTDAAKTE
jgi:hypothetical protein